MQALGRHYPFFDQLFLDFPDALVIAHRQSKTGDLGLDFVITDLNAAAEKIFGYTRREVLAKTLRQWGEMTFLEAEVLESRIALLREVLESRAPISLQEYRKTKQGLRIFVGVQLYFVQSESLEAVVLHYQDLRLQRKLENLIREADRLRFLKELGSYVCAETSTALGRTFLPFFSDAAGREIHQLNEDVRSALQLLSPRLATSGITLERYLDPGGPLVNAARRDIIHALFNLLRNAEQALQGRADPRLKVTTQCSSTQALVAIEDNGPGIPLASLGQVFEPFFTTHGEKSAGMGLSVAYDIIRSNGGDLGVESREGKGSSFFIELPLVQKTKLFRGARKEKKKILLIEDEANVVQLLTRYFTKRGYGIDSALDGPAGLRKVSLELPDVVLLDILLPGQDGLEVLSEIKTKAPQTPVIMLSGVESRGVIEKALEMGADAYVTKPFDLEELEKVIEQTELKS